MIFADQLAFGNERYEQAAVAWIGGACGDSCVCDLRRILSFQMNILGSASEFGEQVTIEAPGDGLVERISLEVPAQFELSGDYAALDYRVKFR